MLVHVRDVGSIESSCCVFPIPTYSRATFDEELFHNLYLFLSPRIRVIIWSFVSFTFYPLHLIPPLINSAIR